MGAHGSGIKAFCGKMFSWPTDRCTHQNKCKECIKITADHNKLKTKLSKATLKKHLSFVLNWTLTLKMIVFYSFKI